MFKMTIFIINENLKQINKKLADPFSCVREKHIFGVKVEIEFVPV